MRTADHPPLQQRRLSLCVAFGSLAEYAEAAALAGDNVVARSELPGCDTAGASWASTLTAAAPQCMWRLWLAVGPLLLVQTRPGGRVGATVGQEKLRRSILAAVRAAAAWKVTEAAL